uniref:tRNA (32-2'-O)-methyltransferase regulator THADA n=1 Tax=Scleropages formosus TaxID=113540 RepID=A0A8C9W827_SCLFO
MRWWETRNDDLFDPSPPRACVRACVRTYVPTYVHASVRPSPCQVLCFYSHTASLSMDGDPGTSLLAQNLLNCLCVTDPVQQVQLVKKAGTLLVDLKEDASPPNPLLVACLETLAIMYTSLQAKNPLKKAVASTLCSVPAWLQESAVVCLSARLFDCFSTLGPDHYPHLTDCVTSCLDGFPIGRSIISMVLKFLQKALSEYLQMNRNLAGCHVAQAQLMQSCLAAVKASMLVVQRSQEPIRASLWTFPSQCPLQDILIELLHCHTQILMEEDLLQVVQSTAGMAVVVLIRIMLGNGDRLAEVVKVDPSTPQWLKESCAGLYQRKRPSAVSLYLCHGTLAMLTWRDDSLGSQGDRLLLLVPRMLISLDTSVKESSTAMVVARVLTLWSGAALERLQGLSWTSTLREALRGGSELTTCLLEHAHTQWEHPLDGVRHQTRALFQNLLRLHQMCVGTSDLALDHFVVELTQSLMGLEWHVRGKYGSLGCLVEHFGARHLLALDSQLPARLLSLMGDQTLAPYASDLLEKLFVSHKAELSERKEKVPDWIDQWHLTWITPLLEVLCQAQMDETTYILDYFLPKLLRCSPSSLGHMVQALLNMPSCTKGRIPGSRGALGALMTCLRAARSQGVLCPTTDGLWGGMVPLSLLRQALVHTHDQVTVVVQFNAFHRSTESVSSQEMDLIRHFLPWSLNSQSPGGRQQTVSLLKKLLWRMNDSAQLMRKRLGRGKTYDGGQEDQRTLEMYQAFLCWLCEMLFQAVFAGASYTTCLTSLQLLGLVAEIFTFSAESDGFALGESVSCAYAQTVLHCLASNFLEVKQLASTLLRKLPPPAVGLEGPDRMQLLLKVALDLSSSTKPFDSVTAAHLINLLVHLEGIPEALERCAQEQGASIQLPSPAVLRVSQASTLERNTLSVVQFLLRCLWTEVAQAELSLLRAAATCPLYGRTHCITASLQQLDTRNLFLRAEWKRVVSELIDVSYRMSEVVSPVVQSSSPEGLIPMDTDSETSAGLQRILQEIQPQDTNNFFTEARELNAQMSRAIGSPDLRSCCKVCICFLGGSSERYRVTAQMVLVCCWRSMKEVCMLLGQLCQAMPLEIRETQKDGVITEEQVEGVGRYFREQLLQSRHRGAFELAYVGFVHLTDMLCRSGSQTLQQLPKLWLKEVLEQVKSSDPSSKLCATRRSAGIPFYIQALLSSEPKSSSCSLLKATMKELIGLAIPPCPLPTGHSTVPQVHALNILRALYRDTRLGENIVPFVSEGMQAAVLGFTSPVWAVRNSSTLLFSTLITRIFGVKKGKDEHSKKNRMTGREFFTRFPALYPFLLQQLKEAAETVDSDSGQVKLHPSLFLLLLILGRLYPSPMDGSSSPLGLASFRPFIIKCGHSAVYRTREMAARALVPFVLVTKVPSIIQTLLKELPLESGPKCQQNHIHGTLLQVLHLLHSYQKDTHRPHSDGQENDIAIVLQPYLWLATRQNPCLVTRASLLDLLWTLCGSQLWPGLTKLREETLAILMDSELFASGSLPATSPGATQYFLSLARVATSASIERPELWGVGSRGPLLLTCLLQCPQYEVRQLVLDVALEALEKETGDSSSSHHISSLLRNISHMLTSMALHETHPPCLAKVLLVLSSLSLTSVLPWRDGISVLTDAEVLKRLLALAEDSPHSVELHCAVLTLTSQLIVHLAESGFQSVVQVIVLHWGTLVTRCCTDEEPVEVKLMAAEVLVKATPSLLANSTLPLRLVDTVALWRSLFTLLQDEDQDVRDRASRFATMVPAQLLLADGVVPWTGVCSSVALELGVGLLCQLFRVWGQVSTGVFILADWLLGDAALEREPEEMASLDEDFLFEKGELNLWAEPLKWARLLHRHLSCLLRLLGVGEVSRGQLDELSSRAESRAQATGWSLQALPPLPQFSCTAEHERLTVLSERTMIAQKKI